MAKVYTIENVTPEILRIAIRDGQVNSETIGMCNNYLQANVVIVPKYYAHYFQDNERLSNKGCRVLEILESGNPIIRKIAVGVDIRESLSRYRVLVDGQVVEERSEIKNLWQNDFVTFLIDCKCNLGKQLFKEKLVNGKIDIESEKIPKIMITNVPGHMLITDLLTGNFS